MPCARLHNAPGRIAFALPHLSITVHSSWDIALLQNATAPACSELIVAWQDGHKKATLRQWSMRDTGLLTPAHITLVNAPSSTASRLPQSRVQMYMLCSFAVETAALTCSPFPVKPIVRQRTRSTALLNSRLSCNTACSASTLPSAGTCTITKNKVAAEQQLHQSCRLS